MLFHIKTIELNDCLILAYLTSFQIGTIKIKKKIKSRHYDTYLKPITTLLTYDKTKLDSTEDPIRRSQRYSNAISSDPCFFRSELCKSDQKSPSHRFAGLFIKFIN